MTRIVGSARLGALGVGLLAVANLGTLALAQAPTQAGFPALGSPPIVTISSTGAEPRQAIRYAIANGRKDHMTLDLRMSIAMDMAGMAMPSMQLPTMRMGADLSVTDVNAAGDASYKMAFTDLNWVKSSDVDPDIMAALQASAVDLTTLSGGATISSRGISRNVTLDTSKVTNPQVAQMMGSMSSAIQQLSLPFPEEAVGIGARWTVRQAMSTGAMQTYQKFDVEVTALDATSCTFKIASEQSAPPQAVTLPGLPPGVQASLESLSGTGTGTMTVHFDSLVPQSEATMKTATVMNVAMGGDSQRMSVQASIGMKVAPAK